MADYQSLKIESMLDCFEAIKYLGLMSEDQVTKELQKRRNFEYKIVRKQKSIKFFLEFIQSDYIFLEKIRTRRVAMKCDHKKNEIEYKLVGRIHDLWRLVITKYGGDLKTWASYAAFCKKWKQKGQLSSLCRMITSMHGDKKHIHLLAAKWQFEDCNSFEDSIKTLMTAYQKFNYDASILVEIFRLHMLQAEKDLVKRRNFGEDVDEDENEHVNRTMTIYKEARGKHTANSEICFEMMSIALKYDNVVAEKIAEQIHERISEDFSSDPKVCSTIVLNRMAKKNTSSVTNRKSEENYIHVQSLIDDKAVADMREFVEKSGNNPNMVKEFVFFLKKLAGSHVESCKIKSRRLQMLKQEVESIADFNMFSDEEAVELVEFLNSEFCHQSSLDLLNKRNSDKAEVSFVKLQTLMCMNSDDADKYFYEVSSHMKGSANNKELVENFFLTWMQAAIMKSDAKLMDDICFKHASSEYYKPDLTYKCKLLYLKKICLTESVDQAYQVYKRMMECFACSEKLHLKAVDVFATGRLSQVKLDAVHNFGVNNYGTTCVDVWVKYCRYLRGTMRGGMAHNAWSNAQHKLNKELVQNFIERSATEVFNSD